MTYPELRDKEDGRSYDAINAAIKRAAEQYKDSYRSYPDGVTSSGYVTYMDEEKISVVFQHRLSEENGTLPRMTAVNFRIETGEQLAPSEMAEIDEELVMRFRAQDQTQKDVYKRQIWDWNLCTCGCPVMWRTDRRLRNSWSSMKKLRL